MFNAAIPMPFRFTNVSTDCPRLVATIGLHGSASTWVFNAVRELMAEAVGEDTVLADWLGLAVAPMTIKTVFDRYRTDAVRSFVQTIPNLPAERLRMVRTTPADKVTYYLTKHIGDGRSGKWRDLPINARDELTRIFQPFLRHFSYSD